MKGLRHAGYSVRREHEAIAEIAIASSMRQRLTSQPNSQLQTGTADVAITRSSARSDEFETHRLAGS